MSYDDEWPALRVRWPSAGAGRARGREAAQERAARSRRSSSRAAASPRPSGARRGATTWRATATSRTACRAAAPTSATARWSTCRSRRGEVTALVSGSELYKVAIDITRCRQDALAVDLRGLRGRDRLAGRAAAGPAGQGRDGADLPPGRRAVPQAGGDQASRAVARTGRRCASTSRRCCTASARGSTTSRSCSSACAASTRPSSSQISTSSCRYRGGARVPSKILEGGDLSALFGLEMAAPPAVEQGPSSRGPQAGGRQAGH